MEAEWLRLTREVLPGLARFRAWPVSADHCFQRIMLDAVCEGPWMRRIAGRPAYAHADIHLLRRAVALALASVEGDYDLIDANERSLRWRSALRRKQHAFL